MRAGLQRHCREAGRPAGGPGRSRSGGGPPYRETRVPTGMTRAAWL